METETQTPEPTVRLERYLPGRFQLRRIGQMPVSPGLTRDELQSIVQQAYDEHGILAQPWTAAPDTRDPAVIAWTEAVRQDDEYPDYLRWQR